MFLPIIEKSVATEIDMLKQIIRCVGMTLESMIDSEMYSSEEIATEREELAGYKSDLARFN